MENLDQRLIRLGRSDIQISKIGIGAMSWGDPALVPLFSPARLAYGLSTDKDEQKQAIANSLAAGVNFIDTAAMYGKGASELRVGELTEGKPFVIATKFPAKFSLWYNDMPKDLDASLHRLRRQSITLYQIHYPYPGMSIPKILHQLADAIKVGKIKAVGVSNFSAEQMRLSHKILAEMGLPLVSNQVEYSLLHRQPETNGVLEACRELGISLIAYMPLRMGALTGKYSSTVRPTGMRKYMGVFRGKEMAAVNTVVELLREIGSRYAKSPAQVALRWLIQQGNVIPIPGAKNGEQASHNAGALTFALTDSELEAVGTSTLHWR